MKGGGTRTAIQAVQARWTAGASGQQSASTLPPASVAASAAGQTHSTAEQRTGSLVVQSRAGPHVVPGGTLVVRHSPPLPPGRGGDAACGAGALLRRAGPAPASPLVLEISSAGGVTVRLQDQQRLIISSGAAPRQGRDGGPVRPWLFGFLAGGTCSAALLYSALLYSAAAPGSSADPQARQQQQQQQRSEWLQRASLFKWGSAKADAGASSPGRVLGALHSSSGSGSAADGRTGCWGDEEVAIPTPWLRRRPDPEQEAPSTSSGRGVLHFSLPSLPSALAAVGAGASPFSSSSAAGSSPRPSPPPPGDGALMRSSISAAAAAVAPAVVHIVVSEAEPWPGHKVPGDPRAGVSSSGSGFLYDATPSHAHVLTNAHVVLPGAGGPAGVLAPGPAGGLGPTGAGASALGGCGGSGRGGSGGGRGVGGGGGLLRWLSTSGRAAPVHGPSGGNSGAAAQHQRVRRRDSFGQQQVMVHTSDGRVFQGRVVALDRPSDLAVVRVDLRSGGDAGDQGTSAGGAGGGGAAAAGTGAGGNAAAGARPAAPLSAARLGSSARLQVGEWVCALGSPLTLRRTVTAGIVSAVERSSSELGIHMPRQAFVQTDASINLGSSGGPLVNLDGEVVGILSMKAVAGDGMAFCIPVDTAKEVVEELSRHGRVRRPRIGAAIAEVPPPRMAQLQASCPDFPGSVSCGLVVTGVQRGGPAEAAGLREDDVIVAWEGAGAGPAAAPAGREGVPQPAVAAATAAGGVAAGGSLERKMSRKDGNLQGGGGGGGAVQAAAAAAAALVTPNRAHVATSADLIAAFTAALKRHLDGPPLRLTVVRQAGGGCGGYEFVDLDIRPEESGE